MPVRVLPPHPSLEQLKHQAKDLVKAHAARSMAAAQIIREFHPRLRGCADAAIFAAPFKLSDAQLTIAREAGFLSWARLKRRIEKPLPSDRLDLPHHERIEDPLFRRAVDLIDAGDEAGLRAHLKQHPGLTRQRVVFEGMNYFHHPSLLEFIAENPVRHNRMPENIVAVTEAILDAGVDEAALHETLGLVATGSVAREAGKQACLIDLLCDRGADPASALQAAAVLGEHEAVRALLRRGAPLTLAVAAALGRYEDFLRMLPSSGPDARHLALAVASDFGRIEIVRLLLDAGEDPNRFNPVGGHSHATPLHQAALHGNMQLAALLVEHGARVDSKDLLWNQTPAGWARYSGKAEVEAFLLAQEGGAGKRF